MYVAFLPEPPIQSEPPFIFFDWLASDFTVLPMQMFNWTSRPGEDFRINAAATGLVLITVTLTLNALAIVVRYRVRKRIKW
jgi:phosphate transport system permease protein